MWKETEGFDRKRPLKMQVRSRDPNTIRNVFPLHNRVQGVSDLVPSQSDF